MDVVGIVVAVAFGGSACFGGVGSKATPKPGETPAASLEASATPATPRPTATPAPPFPAADGVLLLGAGPVEFADGRAWGAFHLPGGQQGGWAAMEFVTRDDQPAGTTPSPGGI